VVSVYFLGMSARATPRKPTALRRAEISDAALRLVATRGIAALSTAALADAVGLSSGALLKHFPNRDAILAGMAERVAALLQATDPDPSLPPRARLERLAQARLVMVTEQVGVLELVQSEQLALALPEAAARALRGAVERTLARVAQAIREGQQTGDIRADVPAEALASLFVGAVRMTTLARRQGPAAADPLALDAFHTLIHTPIRPEHP
jgi:AcrR family transcriptional regulator